MTNEEKARYQELIDKWDAKTMSKAEVDELLRLCDRMIDEPSVDQSEQIGAVLYYAAIRVWIAQHYKDLPP